VIAEALRGDLGERVDQLDGLDGLRDVALDPRAEDAVPVLGSREGGHRHER
jgi:hypothetical protein